MKIEKTKQNTNHRTQLTVYLPDAIFPPVYKVIVFAHSQSHVRLEVASQQKTGNLLKLT